MDPTHGELRARPMKRYRLVKRETLAARGAKCEACGTPSNHVHHVAPVSDTGIASELVYDPANLLVLCDDCHCLFHPGYRTYPWLTVGVTRGRMLQR